MPAYLVEITKPIPVGKYIVRVGTAQAALRYVWKQNSTVEPLTTDQLMSAMEDGFKVIDARTGADEPPASTDGVETYAHKIACPAGSSTPIGKGNCRCPDLDI